MKKKSNNIALLKLILAFILICIPQCIDASHPQQSTQQHERTSENSNLRRNSKNLSNPIASKNAPQSEEAKMRKNPHGQLPKQGMKNDNFSNVDETYKRIIDSDDLFGSENLKFDETEKKNFFDDGEMTGLLGSIENSVRKDNIDLSSVVTKENGFHTKEISRNEVQNSGKEKGILSNKVQNSGTMQFKSNSLKDETKKSKERIESRRITTPKAESKDLENRNKTIEVSKEQDRKPINGKQSLSRKKLETSLSNEGRKKANENRIVYDSNFSSTKKMEEFGSGASGENDDDDDDTSGERKGSGVGENTHRKGGSGSGEIEAEESGSGDRDEEGSTILESKQRFSQKIDRVKTIGQITQPVSKSFWNGTLEDQPYMENKKNEKEDGRIGESEVESSGSGSGDDEGSTILQSKHMSSQITDRVKQIGQATPIVSNNLWKENQTNKDLLFASSQEQKNDTKILSQASIQGEMKVRTQNDGNSNDSKIEVKIEKKPQSNNEFEESSGDSKSASDVSKEQEIVENKLQMENKDEIETTDRKIEGSGHFSEENSADESNKSSEEYSKYMKDWVKDNNEEFQNNETDLAEQEENTQEKAEVEEKMLDGSGEEENNEISNEISEKENEDDEETDKENDQNNDDQNNEDQNKELIDASHEERNKESIDTSQGEENKEEVDNYSEDNDQITNDEDRASGIGEVNGETRSNDASIKEEEKPAFEKTGITASQSKELDSSRVVKLKEKARDVNTSGSNEETKAKKIGSLGQFEGQTVQQEESSGDQEDEFESGSSSGSGESESGWERNDITPKLQAVASGNFERDDQYSGLQNENEMVPLQGAWETYSKLNDYGMGRNEKGDEKNHLYYKLSKKDSKIDSKQNKTMHQSFMGATEAMTNKKVSLANIHSPKDGLNRLEAPVGNGPKSINNGGRGEHLMKYGENARMFGDVDEFGETFERWKDKKETENETQRNISHDKSNAAASQEMKMAANHEAVQVSSANVVNTFNKTASLEAHENDAVRQKMKMIATDKPMELSSANPSNTNKETLTTEASNNEVVNQQIKTTATDKPIQLFSVSPPNTIKESVSPEVHLNRPENTSPDSAEQVPRNASQQNKNTPGFNKTPQKFNESSSPPKESEETLEELNNEIIKEELKSKAMMSYLEKIDAELGEETKQGFGKMSKQTKEKGNLNLLNSSTTTIKEDVTNKLKNKIHEEAERNKEKETSKQNETDGQNKNNLTKTVASFMENTENVREQKKKKNLMLNKENDKLPSTNEIKASSKASNGMNMNKINESKAENNSTPSKLGTEDKNSYINNIGKNLSQNFTNVDHQHGSAKKNASNALLSNEKDIENTSNVRGETGEKDDGTLDDFVKGIFKGLEKTIEQKLEKITMKNGTGNQNAVIRDKIEMKESKNKGSIVGNIVNGLTEKGLNEDFHLQEQTKSIEQNKQKIEKLQSFRPSKTAYQKKKDFIVVNLHDQDEAIIKRDQSKRVDDSRPGYENDVILKYGKLYGGNSTLVADFSGGEEAAKLFIYPRKKDENAQKKDKVTRNEAAEKRGIGSFGLNRWLFFGIGSGYRKKRSLQDNQDYDGPGGRVISQLGPRIRSRAIDALYRDHRFPNEPSAKEILQSFDAPTGVGYSYGQLMWGWFIAPMDGEYTFFSSCDDECDVYLSPDQGKDRIKKILSQTTWSPHNVWDKDPTQQTSMAIRLAGGKSYYVQAVGAQSGGGDGLSVGVQMPNGVMIRPITRHFLSRAPLAPRGIKQLTPDLQKAQANDIAAAAANGGNANLNGAIMPPISHSCHPNFQFVAFSF